MIEIIQTITRRIGIKCSLLKGSQAEINRGILCSEGAYLGSQLRVARAEHCVIRSDAEGPACHHFARGKKHPRQCDPGYRSWRLQYCSPVRSASSRYRKAVPGGLAP